MKDPKQRAARIRPGSRPPDPAAGSRGGACRASGDATLRLFTALWPGEATRAALVACRDALHWPPGSRPTHGTKLHLTLHFIGAVPPGQLATLAAELTSPGCRFELRFDRVELWRGGLVALMPVAIPDVLGQLHADQAAALRALGLRVEPRAFRPHVTLGRDRPGPLAPRMPGEALRWPVRGHVLVCSRPDGHYQVLQRYPAR